MEPFLANYEIMEIIGTGSSSLVYLARHKVTNLLVAIKMIRKNYDDKSEITRIWREISLMKQVHHPFIAELFEIIDTKDYVYLVMENAERGNIFNLINQTGGFDENSAKKYFIEIILALDYLHTKKYIMHRDLKAENVLVDKYGNVRLIDFGLSNVFSKNEPNLKTVCGSPAYAAPEMITGANYTKAADIWSAGVVLFAMVAGKLPFDDENVQTTLQKVVYSDAEYPSHMSRSLVDLLKRILVKDPLKRLTISQIMHHPWIENNNFAHLLDLNIFFNENTVDKEIIDQMKCNGLNVSNISQFLVCDEFNELTSIYRQLKKCKITETINNMINTIANQKISSNRSFPSIVSRNNYLIRQTIRTTDSLIAYGLNTEYNSNQIQLPNPRRMSRPVVLKKKIGNNCPIPLKFPNNSNYFHELADKQV